MRRTPLFIFMLASVFLATPFSFAQTAEHHHSAPASPVTPGGAWMSIEENMRNLTDALKKDDLTNVPAYVEAMVSAHDFLMGAHIHNEVKPQEEEHLKNSLEHLKTALDDLKTASHSGDKSAIEAAALRASGAVTLTRIDVPPGLLEKISGAGVRAEIVNTPLLQKDKPQTVTLRLKNAITGKALKPEDLDVVHAEIVHALIIDPQLADYTHAHPVENDIPGEYAFDITPKTDCTYRLWADVTPVKGKQEYAVVDIPGKDGCGSLSIDRTQSLEARADSYAASLKLPEKGLKPGQESTLEFTITDENGKALANLEPLMGAYAHVAGFYDDYRKIAHLHPLGDGPKTDEDRGAAPLSYHFKPEQSGFVKLFLQIRVNGQEKYFPFGVTVQE